MNNENLPSADLGHLRDEVKDNVPREDVRLAVEEIWRSVLDLGEIGPGDHFIDLGGDSIAAVQIVARVQRRFGIRLSTDAVFERPTTIELAGLIADAMARGPE